jgi:hypothetical protein
MSILTRTGSETVTSITGTESFYCGFRPKALILWYPGGNSNGYNWQWNFFNVGWAIGPSAADQREVGVEVRQGSVVYGTGTNNNLLLYYPFVWNISLSSFDDCGFTLNVPNANDHPGVHFNWVAIAGDDLEVAIGDFTLLDNDTSDIPVTGVGFQPDFLLSLLGPADFMNAAYGIGMASAPSEQAAAMFHLSHSQITTRFESGALSTYFQYSGDLFKCSLKSFDTDGFTVSVSETWTNAVVPTHPVYWLALKSPSTSFMAGIETQKTSTGTKATTGLGFRPGAALFAGTTSNTAANQTIDQSPYKVGIQFGAAADGQSSVAYAGMNMNPYQQDYRGVTGKVLSMSAPLSVTNAEAGLSSFDADGFTLDWTTADATARYFLYGAWEANVQNFTCEPDITSFDIEFPQ